MSTFLGNRKMPPAVELMGYRAVSAGDGRAEVHFTPPASFANLMGAVQGGFVCAMLDSAASSALLAELELDQFAPTLELKTSFLRPVPVGPLVGRGRIVHRGRSIAFLEGSLHDPSDNLLATCTLTAKIIRIKD